MKSLHNIKLIISLLLYFYSINSPKCYAYYNMNTKHNPLSSETITKKNTLKQYDSTLNNFHDEYSDDTKHDPLIDNHFMMSSLNDVLSSSSSLLSSSLLPSLSSSSSSSSSASASSSSSSHSEIETHRCEPVTLILCKGMYYEYTRLPNMFHHETQEEAGLEAHQFYPLVQINCSKDLRFLLCSIYTPICIKGYPHFLPPCRSICERVKAGCSPIMEHYEFPWPERMNCEQFPEYNNPDGILCMERNLTHEEQLEFQSINIKNNEQFKSINQSSINQLNQLSNNLHKTSQLQIINTNDQMKSLSLEEIEFKNQFNEEASYLLFEKAIQNDDIHKLKMTFPNLHLKCTCDCRPPLINIKNSEINNNAKITVADIKDCSMPCYTPYYTFDSSYNFTTLWLGIWSTLCAISTMITIFTFITDSYRFQYPELPLIYLSACYFMISMGYLIRVFMGHQAIACDSLPYEYESIQSTMNSNNDNNWFDYNSSNVTLLPNTLTTITKATLTMKKTNQLIRSKILRYALTGRVSCAVVFLLIYFFSMAASIWWVVLALTWLLAAGLKWGSEAISKYSQVFHFIAWSLPASQTALALLLSIVEGDPISGLCTIQSNKSITYILFIFAPLLIYLMIGIILMIIGFIALFHIRGKIKLQRPHFIETQKLDKLILRIGIFGMLYTIPNLIILFSIGYELRHTYLWQLGIACHCHYDIGQYHQINNNNNNQEGEQELEPILPIALPVWNSPKPVYTLIMLKHFMNLIIGIISGFWIWSNKTIQSWKQFCLHKLCLFQWNKYKSNSNGLLINPIHHHIDYDRLHKNYMKQSIYIPSMKSIQSMTHNKSIHQSINQYPVFIDNNEYCNTIVMTTNSSITITTTNTTTTTTTSTNTLRQHNITSYDLMNNGILSNINSLVTLSTPSTPFSTHPYDIPNHHDIQYKPSLNAYYSIDGSTISQQYGDVNSYHTNNSFSNSNSNNNNNSNIDNKCMITNTKSYVTQLSGNSMNPSFSTLSSSLNSPQKSSVSHLNNNNNNNHNLNHANNNNSMSTGISSSGISSSHINDGLTRTASILIGSELNSKSISPKLIDYYFNGEQRNRELIGSQLTTTTTTTATITTTTTTTTATTVLSMIKYDRNMDENNLRRNNHSVFVSNQFVSNMMNENHKNNLSLVQ
ncbi:unnamed protein product [Schistosoma bovis]|nr:unnamed protein product [Schistosoma bovis]